MSTAMRTAPASAWPRRTKPTGRRRSRNIQTYLRKVLYGNRTPYFVDYTAAAEPAAPAAADWMFAVSLDYGDHGNDGADPNGDLDGAVPIRSRSIDRVSRSAPIVASSVCCSSTTFPNETGIGAYGLVRSLDLCLLRPAQRRPIRQGPIYTFLSLADPDRLSHRRARPAHQSLPPLEFDYSQPTSGPDHPCRRSRQPQRPAGRRGRIAVPLARSRRRGVVGHHLSDAGRLVLQAKPQRRQRHRAAGQVRVCEPEIRGNARDRSGARTRRCNTSPILDTRWRRHGRCRRPLR